MADKSKGKPRRANKSLQTQTLEQLFAGGNVQRKPDAGGIRALWDEASRVQVGMEIKDGKMPTLSAVWKRVRPENAPKDIPAWVRRALDETGYKRLVRTRRRLNATEKLEGIAMLKDMVSDGSLTSMNLLTERLITEPESINTPEMRKIAKDMVDMQERLEKLVRSAADGKAGDEDPVSGEAVKLYEDREQMLKNIPDTYRDKVDKLIRREQLRANTEERTELMPGAKRTSEREEVRRIDEGRNSS